MTTVLQVPLKVVRVLEHSKVIHGRRDPISGALTTESVNLGYFLHLEFLSGESFGVALGIGPDKPDDINPGDTLLFTLKKSDAPLP